MKMSTEECCDIETLKVSIEQAEKDVDVAERHLKNSQLKLKYLQQQLQDMIIADVGGLKTASEVKVQDESRGEEDEDTRRARVKRRWRILGMKIKFGLGAQALATKRRNIQDASSFIDRESEVIRFLGDDISYFDLIYFLGGLQRRST